MIALKNRARESFTVNLDLAHDYGDHPECAASVSRMVLPAVLPDGTEGQLHRVVQLPGSLTWLAGEEKVVPDDVAKLAPIKLRVAQGLMTLTQLPDSPAPAAPPKPAQAASVPDAPPPSIPVARRARRQADGG